MLFSVTIILLRRGCLSSSPGFLLWHLRAFIISRRLPELFIIFFHCFTGSFALSFRLPLVQFFFTFVVDMNRLKLRGRLYNGMTQSNIPYKQQTLEHFSSFSKHPVVDSLLNTWKKGWGVDDPVFFMLCLNKDFHLMEGLHPDQVSRGGGLSRLQQLAGLFGDFARQSDFYTWFNETQRPFPGGDPADEL